jgi:hypothetical protein
MRGQLRRHTASLLLLLAAACAPEPPRPPGLWFEETVQDLGRMTSGEDATLRFPFEVVGEEVVLSALEPGCGCLGPRLELAGERVPLGTPLPPGSRGAVVVEYRTAGFQGRKDTLLSLRGRGPGLPLELEVRSELAPWFEVEPDRWTPPPLEGTGPWEVELRVTGPEPFRLVGAAGPPPEVRVEGVPSAAASQEHTVRLLLPAEEAGGAHAWFLSLEADNGLSTVVPFQYAVEQEVWTRPDRVVRLGTVPRGTEVQATVDLGASHGELEVLESRVEGLAGARVEVLNLTPSRSYRVRIQVPAGSSRGVLSGRLELRLRHLVDGEARILDRRISLAGVVE